MQSLSLGENKALALHRWLAERLRADPALTAMAIRRIEWLEKMNPAGAPYYCEWKALLEGPRDDLLAVMVSPSERSCALRQESPFFDLVDQRERARLHRETAASFKEREQA